MILHYNGNKIGVGFDFDVTTLTNNLKEESKTDSRGEIEIPLHTVLYALHENERVKRSLSDQ